MVSPRMTALLADLARQQGLDRLAFNADGLVPIRLDRKLDIAIGYSPANDQVFLFAAVATEGAKDRIDPWHAFRRNVGLAERRTRLSLDPTGNLILSADAYLEGLDFPGFSAMLDRFVLDLEDEIAAIGDQRAPFPPAQSSAPPPDDAVMIRV